MNISNYNGERIQLDITAPATDLAKQWQGWGTCLKPAYEPIIVARKPFKGSLVDNVMEYGVGGLNIDECRVGTQGATRKIDTDKCTKSNGIYGDGLNGGKVEEINQGRFPANIIHDGLKEEWSRYFYFAKTSKKDRDEGLEKSKNTHPTVKPTELMQYLIRLVSPKGSTILDPFMGSGSTGKAVMYENKERNANYKFIGIELTEEYLPIAEARINYASNLKQDDKQMTIFDLEEL